MTQNITSTVYCKLSLEATHCWSTCDIDEVDYLRYTHRHVFHIIAYKPVFHDDRDVEFICLKHDIQEYLRSKYFNEAKRLHVLGMMSCEMLARELIDQFGLTMCDVSEDAENGAVLRVE